jgi:dTDP-D-glucose 4,6-dehydratase
LALDSEKAKLELGWTPRFSQEKAIVSTIEWWKLVLAGANPLTVCIDEITGYLGNNLVN